MGGDFAPEVAIEGAVMSLKLLDKESRIVLYGDEKRIRELIKKHGASESDFDIVATTQVIEMGDHPAKAFIAKRDSSMTRGFNDLAEGKIDGFASAGSTGAMMVGSMQVIKPIEGVIRPVLATLIPTVSAEKGIQRAVLMDVGLNVDAKPEVLAQYGLLGSIYAKSALNMKNPRVALLNIGEEEGKGNAQAKATYDLMKADKRYNFVGNVEASYIFTGKIGDVVVADAALLRGSDITELFSDVVVVGVQCSLYDGDIVRRLSHGISLYAPEEDIVRTVSEAVDAPSQVSPQESHELSDRERDVLILVARGFTNKEIASELNISPHTVISHRKNIVHKTGIRSVAGLTVYAVLNKLITNEQL